MEQEQIEEKAAALTLLFGKRVDEEDIEKYRDEIGSIFDPLPPPWTWRRIRQAAGLTITQMSAATGNTNNMIGRWEVGRGTMDAAAWVRYGDQLSRMSEEAFAGGPAAEPVWEPEPDSPAVDSIRQQLQASVNTLEAWASQVPPCTVNDATLTLANIAAIQKALRRVESQLRKVAGIRHPSGRKARNDRA